MQLSSSSEDQTRRWGERFAEVLSQRHKPVFIQLKGTLGAGKSTFARGFITRWTSLYESAAATEITSPTFNLVRVYGEKKPIAHFDLYRIKSLAELEQLGFEQYFYETPACLVEWLELIAEEKLLRPSHALVIELSFDPNDPSQRQIDVQSGQLLEDEVRKLFSERG